MRFYLQQRRRRFICFFPSCFRCALGCDGTKTQGGSQLTCSLQQWSIPRAPDILISVERRSSTHYILCGVTLVVLVVQLTVKAANRIRYGAEVSLCCGFRAVLEPQCWNLAGLLVITRADLDRGLYLDRSSD